MSWYVFAFLAPLLWAVSNHIDKFILSRYLKGGSSGTLAIFAGLVGSIFSAGVLIFLGREVLSISAANAVIIVLNGALLIAAFVPYYYALNEEDASLVVPLYQTIPIFSFVLGFFLLGETIDTKKIVAGIAIIIGAVLISVDLDKEHFKLKNRVLLLMLLSSLMIAVHFLVFKFVALEESFWITVFWEYLGAILLALGILAFSKKFRGEFVGVLKKNSAAVIAVNLTNEIINIGAKLCANYATLLVPVVIVNLANGIQPLFVFVIGLVLTLFYPHVSKEQIKARHLAQRIAAIIVIFAGTYFLVI